MSWPRIRGIKRRTPETEPRSQILRAVEAAIEY